MIDTTTKGKALFLIYEYLRKHNAPGLPLFKNLMRTALFRSAWYSDDHDELERIFRSLKDPWNFESSPYERERMKVLLREVERYRPASILEVGCAEGAFTMMLSTVTGRVVGIDVSPTAISRAQQRCPGLTFNTTSLEAFEPEEKFEVVICAETLYYIQDVRTAIDKLSSLGRRCIVSYIRRESGRLDGEIGRIPGIEMRTFEFGTKFLRRGMVAATWDAEHLAAGSHMTLNHRLRQSLFSSNEGVGSE
jgi:SAM-dependent methyltransferase